MNHRAFSLDWSSFVENLKPQLEAALVSGEPGPLEHFVEVHRSRILHPDLCEPLPKTWRSLLVTQDAQEIGDLALALYYDPRADGGLDDLWLELSDELPEAAAAALLGHPIGGDNVFDPGKIGSYFQSPDELRQSVEVLKFAKCEPLNEYLTFLDSIVATSRGLYVTF